MGRKLFHGDDQDLGAIVIHLQVSVLFANPLLAGWRQDSGRIHDVDASFSAPIPVRMFQYIVGYRLRTRLTGGMNGKGSSEDDDGHKDQDAAENDSAQQGMLLLLHMRASLCRAFCVHNHFRFIRIR